MLRLIVLLGFLLAHVAVAADVSVQWWCVDNHLYDSDGTDMRAASNRFQLVLDISNNTDVAAMISSNFWAIGTEHAETSFYGSDDDVTITAQNANWIFEDNFGYLDVASGFDETLYGDKPFYFRFFNAAAVGDATEAGLVYNTAKLWKTPSSNGDFPAYPELGRVGGESADIAGSTHEARADGWATMADPSGSAPSSGPMFRFK